jgi:hypothetical protein
MERPKPLGYWLQRLHNLLEEQFAAVLSDLGLDRRQWQLLNTLAGGAGGRDELKNALAPFWTDGEPDPDRTLAGLAGRGWVAQSQGVFALTPAGAAAHVELARRVDRSRAAVMEGLTPDQYSETVRILSVMAANVETAIASARGQTPGEPATAAEATQAQAQA